MATYKEIQGLCQRDLRFFTENLLDCSHERALRYPCKKRAQQNLSFPSRKTLSP